MEEKKRMAYLPLKEFSEGKADIAKIEMMKDCLLRGDYVEDKISEILGCDTNKERLSYLPVDEYTEGIIATSRIKALERAVISSSYGVSAEIIVGILGIELPEKEINE